MSDEDKTTEQPEENKEIGTSVQKTEAAPVSKDAPEEHQDEATDDGATPVAFPHRDLKPGMVVRVHEVIKDTNAKGEERERVQMFEGTVLGLNGSGIGDSEANPGGRFDADKFKNVMGRISQEQAADMSTVMADLGGRVIDTLVSLGILKSHEVIQVYQEFMKVVSAGVLQFKEGSYVFYRYQGTPPPSINRPVCSTCSLILVNSLKSATESMVRYSWLCH